MSVTTTIKNEKKITNIIKRGQVWMANLGTTIGSEQGGKRPVLVVQNDIGNKYSPTLTVVPLTSKQNKNKLPTHVMINEPYLTEISIALIEQVRTIDKVRLIEFMGKTNDYIMIEIDRALEIQNGLRKEFSYDKAFEILDQIVNINKIINQIGNLAGLNSNKNFLMKQFKEYCSDHRINHNIIVEVYKNQKVRHAV